jgi:hypothetical protein
MKIWRMDLLFVVAGLYELDAHLIEPNVHGGTG